MIWVRSQHVFSEQHSESSWVCHQVHIILKRWVTMMVWVLHLYLRPGKSIKHKSGNNEPMPLEESGNMLIMTLSYIQKTNDQSLAKTYVS